MSQPIYAPGSEPEKIRARLERILSKLDQAYPDKLVVSISSKHKHWAETLVDLRRMLGYETTHELLAAYGYTMVSATGGRPRNDANSPESIIAELHRRYPNGSSLMKLCDLTADNPDLSAKLNRLGQSARAVFGMTLSKYLRKEGLLAHKISEEKKPETIVAELQRRYPNGSPFNTIAKLIEANPDLAVDIRTLQKNAYAAFGLTAAKYLKKTGLLKKATGSATSHRNHPVK